MLALASGQLAGKVGFLFTGIDPLRNVPKEKQTKSSLFQAASLQAFE